MKLPKKIRYVRSILIDSDNNLWIGTSKQGLFRIDSNNNKINFRPDKSNATALTDHTIFSIIQDQSGLIWLGTYRSGVNYFDPKNILFGSYDDSANSLHCLPSSDIRSALYIDNETLLLGTISGLVELNLTDKSCKNHSSILGDSSSLSHNDVLAIYKDTEGILWIGNAGGIDKFDIRTGKFERLGEQINNSLVLRITESKSSLVLGTINGLYRLNRTTGKITPISVEHQKLETTYIQAMDVDENGSIWVGSTDGLLKIDNKLNDVRWVKHQDVSLSQQDIKALVVDKYNHIWFTIEGKGLYKYNPMTKILRAIGKEKEIIPKNGLIGLYIEQKGNLWLATLNYGLIKIDPTNNKLTSYHQSDGLHSELFNFDSFTQFGNDRLLFGGKTGFNLFDPEKIQTNKTPPKVSLTYLKRFAKEVIPHQDYDGFKIDKHISELKELHLSHRDTVFGFDFVATHYLAPEKITYAYKLDGFDPDWTTTGAQNRGVTYNNVDPGEYTFRLKAQTKNGVWSENDVALKVIIAPAPWLTWWAYTIYVISAILSLMIFIKKRTKILEARAQHLQITVDERTKELVQEKSKVEQLLTRKNEEFANVSHEFRTPLTLILGPLAQVLKTNKDQDEINRLSIVQRNGYRLLRMVDQLLNLETFRVKSIALKAPQVFGKTIQLIANAFSDLAEDKNIELVIKNIVNVNFEFTPDALEEIILNLLSNAIKYTKSGGTILIETSRTKNNHLKIQIKDSGIGIPTDQINSIFDRYNRVLDENSEQVTGAGIGLALVKNLVESHQGHIEVESELGKGTTIDVYLPIINEVDNALINLHREDEIIAMELMSLTNQSSIESESSLESNQNSSNQLSTVLVIEDNKDMRDYIVNSIKGDYQVLTAKDGEEGLSIAISEIPDLIISDIMMPKMDGYETTNQLRKNQLANHIPVVLLTARGDRESRLKGWHEKADEYLTKPFDTEELKIRLKNLLEIRNILKKSFAENLFETKPSLDQTDVHPADDVELNRNKQQTLFIEKLNYSLEKFYTEPSIPIARFASEVAMSERQLFRKLKSVLDMTPSEYLRRFRLEKAKVLLDEGQSVSFATFEVGFATQSHFSKCFKAQYGLSPRDYKNRTTTPG